MTHIPTGKSSPVPIWSCSPMSSHPPSGSFLFPSFGVNVFGSQRADPERTVKRVSGYEYLSSCLHSCGQVARNENDDEGEVGTKVAPEPAECIIVIFRCNMHACILLLLSVSRESECEWRRAKGTLASWLIPVRQHGASNIQHSQRPFSARRQSEGCVRL